MSSPILTIDELITPLTPLQVKTKIYEILALLQVSTTNWLPGGVVRLMIAAASIILSALSITISLIARSAFLALSEGDWLTLVARYVFGTERLQASFANGTVRLTNSLGGRFVRDAYSIVISNAAGKTYRNTVGFTLEANSSLPIPFAADETGTDSNSGVGTVTTMVTTMNGVTCSNTTSFVGRDQETDSALIARAQLKPQSLSPLGPRGSYYWFAQTATRLADDSLVGVNRVTVSHSSTTGQVTVLVASAAGGISGAANDATTDLGAVHQNMLRNAVTQCVTLTTQSSVTVTINVLFRAYFDADTNIPVSTQNAVALAAVTAWTTSTDMPIGGVTIEGVGSNRVFRDTLRDIISQGFVTAGYPRPRLVTIVTPSADITLTTAQVPVPGTVQVAA